MQGESVHQWLCKRSLFFQAKKEGKKSTAVEKPCSYQPLLDACYTQNRLNLFSKIHAIENNVRFSV